MLKLYINRVVDLGRRKSMERDWPGFKQWPALDGNEFAADDKYDRCGRPLWDAANRQRAIRATLHKDSPLSPLEYACARSHVDSWKYFLSTDHETAVILEDDVSPVPHTLPWEERLESVKKWNVNFLYLFSPEHPGERIGMNPDGHVKWCRSHMGVLMTRAGAKAAIEAMSPIYLMHDSQVGERICSTWSKKPRIPDDIPDLPKIEMHGLWNGLVEHNKHARHSTLTRDGTKPWLPERCRV